MNTTLEKRNDQKLARPLKVLVPLIKDDLQERKKLRDGASFELETKIGEELIEAKSQLTVTQWGDWLRKNFHLSQSTANTWMRATRKLFAGEEFATLSHVKGDMRKGHEAPWATPVKERAEQARRQMEVFAKQERSRTEERNAERKLGLQIIDIGFKVLATKLHPDKMDGSHEAMRRLNAERLRLKQAA